MACIALRNFHVGASGPTFRAGDVVDGISWTTTMQLLRAGWITEPPEHITTEPPEYVAAEPEKVPAKTENKTWIEIIVEEEV